MFVRRAGEIAGKDAVSHFLKDRNIPSANHALMGWASKIRRRRCSGSGAKLIPIHVEAYWGGHTRAGVERTRPRDQDVGRVTPKRAQQATPVELVTSMLRAVGIDHTQGLVEGMITRASQAGTVGRAT